MNMFKRLFKKEEPICNKSLIVKDEVIEDESIIENKQVVMPRMLNSFDFDVTEDTSSMVAGKITKIVSIDRMPVYEYNAMFGIEINTENDTEVICITSESLLDNQLYVACIFEGSNPHYFNEMEKLITEEDFYLIKGSYSGQYSCVSAKYDTQTYTLNSLPVGTSRYIEKIVLKINEHLPKELKSIVNEYNISTISPSHDSGNIQFVMIKLMSNTKDEAHITILYRRNNPEEFLLNIPSKNITHKWGIPPPISQDVIFAYVKNYIPDSLYSLIKNGTTTRFVHHFDRKDFNIAIKIDNDLYFRLIIDDYKISKKDNSIISMDLTIWIDSDQYNYPYGPTLKLKNIPLFNIFEDIERFKREVLK